jgi:hypothetical protein
MLFAASLLVASLEAANVIRRGPSVARAQALGTGSTASSRTGLQGHASRPSNSDYQLTWPGEAGDLQEWIVVEDGSQWTNTELRIVHNAIQDTIAALDSVGVDGHQVLAGYRFARHNNRFLADGFRRHAQVNHEPRLITLADRAFLASHGFFIYHELGHAVDRQLGRRLSSIFQEQALQPTHTDGMIELADGYWMREQGRDNPAEAAADAFALWVMVEHAGYAMPDFATMPETVDPALILELVREGLH